ncbi:sterol desaturase family protein [Rhodoferax sp. AJA081-3]|uniref:lysoplasmalogenase family protein n=1 Tax=Rhodoferax sp. AJA081-3 TaxID=2752316 RepID=UPI001ADF65D4|nr:lysoplasmalogenase family protein [Rhodoferax sp. AJA081-3]QTN30115.1 sterol desaturase family protein [Rhodoferax sp. AJA081-3]
MSKVIVFATPVFLLLIALELLWSRRQSSRTAGQTPYRLNDAINSISLGMLSQLTGVLSKLFSIGIYVLVFNALALYPDMSFWTTWYGVLLALVFYDFCYYWLHRAGHVVALFWAAHVVHHQSQHYNLTTALRQTSTGFLFGWVFYIPMALAGVPPEVFGAVALIDLLYQFWVHTEQVGKLGWFDRVFCSPSNHRVHHAVNDPYIDKNYGGILILWDRLFGTFREETEPCVYGTRGLLNSWDPLWANVDTYASLAKDSWRTLNWSDKIKLWFKPPGWQSAEMARTNPKPPFTLASVTLYNPPLSTPQQWFAGLQFLLAMAAVLAFLWHVDTMSFTNSAIWCAAIAAGLWANGHFMQGKLHMLEVLAVQSGALATVAALGLMDGYMVFKPLTMLIAIAFVATRARSIGATGQFDILLMVALVFSLIGDVFLMLPGNYFIPGLASFLVAHIFYIALFRQGQTWFPSKKALVSVLAVGVVMYGIVWGGLGDPVLKAAVAAYVGVISLMAAQAIGRATVQGSQDAGAGWVALGACVFMVSDSLIAINKFVTPVALSSLWILATYYAAQLLIVHNARMPKY